MSTSWRGPHKRIDDISGTSRDCEKISVLSYGALYDMSNTSSRCLVPVKVIKP